MLDLYGKYETAEYSGRIIAHLAQSVFVCHLINN